MPNTIRIEIFTRYLVEKCVIVLSFLTLFYIVKHFKIEYLTQKPTSSVFLSDTFGFLRGILAGYRRKIHIMELQYPAFEPLLSFSAVQCRRNYPLHYIHLI